MSTPMCEAWARFWTRLFDALVKLLVAKGEHSTGADVAEHYALWAGALQFVLLPALLQSHLSPDPRFVVFPLAADETSFPRD